MAIERAEEDVTPLSITFPLKAEEGANADAEAIKEVSSIAKDFMVTSIDDFLWKQLFYVSNYVVLVQSSL